MVVDHTRHIPRLTHLENRKSSTRKTRMGETTMRKINSAIINGKLVRPGPVAPRAWWLVKYGQSQGYIYVGQIRVPVEYAGQMVEIEMKVVPHVNKRGKTSLQRIAKRISERLETLTSRREKPDQSGRITKGYRKPTN